MVDARSIAPIRHALVSPRVDVPASKSVTNRELVLSAIASGHSRLVVGPLDPGDDVHTMCDALAALGHEVRWEGERIDVAPGAGNATGRVDAREAGTVARFALALAALSDRETAFDGSARMRERPITSLVTTLRALGATVSGDRFPLTVRGPLVGGDVTVPGSESSQFASALLLVGARMRDGLRLQIGGTLVSAPFVDLTLAALADRGVRVERAGRDRFAVAAQDVRARTVKIPGDVTAASYPAAAAALLGGSVEIRDRSDRRERERQGDVRAFELLERMGCRVALRDGSIRVERDGPLHGIVANVSDCSDVFPTLAVVATQADGPTELQGIGHTRRQESDRIAAVSAGIAALGGHAEAFADAIRVTPGPLHGGTVDAAGDHRIAMAFAVLGLHVPGVAIAGADTVTKTFPTFYEMLAALS